MRHEYRQLRNQGYKASEAYRMVRDRERADELGLSFDWEWDELYTDVLDFCECRGYTDVCVRCGQPESRRDFVCDHAYHEHEVTMLIVRDGNGAILDALGGIVDAGSPSNYRSYAYALECELAGEAIHTLAQNPAIGVTA